MKSSAGNNQTLETDDNYLIRFEISNNSSTIRFKMKNTIRTALTCEVWHIVLYNDRTDIVVLHISCSVVDAFRY